MTAPVPVTLLGKTPARPDFIRINHGGASAIAFDSWLQRSLEELLLAGKRAAPAARFSFMAQDARDVLLGVLAPSKDKAGRAFPISLFVSLPLGLAMDAAFALPHALEPFFESGVALFRELGSLDYEALKQRVSEIRAPEASAYSLARQALDERLAKTEPGAWITRLFGDGGPGVAAAALHALTTADLQATKRIMIDCPVLEPFDAAVWLALSGRGQRAPLSFFWGEPEEAAPHASRLVLGAAPTPHHALLHLAESRPKPGVLRLLQLSPSVAAEAHFEAFAQAKSLLDFLALPR